MHLKLLQQRRRKCYCFIITCVILALALLGYSIIARADDLEQYDTYTLERGVMCIDVEDAIRLAIAADEKTEDPSMVYLRLIHEDKCITAHGITLTVLGIMRDGTTRVIKARVAGVIVYFLTDEEYYGQGI